MTFEQWLAANGYDAEKLTDKERKHLEAAWKAETQPPAPPAPPDPRPTPSAGAGTTYEQEVEAIRREDSRQTRIREITTSAMQASLGNRPKIDAFEQLCNQAITEKWDLPRFELAMLREERSVGPMVLTPRAPQVTNRVMEAAVCLAGGLKTAEKEFDERTLEVAHSQFGTGIDLLELVGLCAAQNGFRGSVKRNLSGAMRAAFRNAGDEMLAVGPSTLDITGILSNTGNKFVREQFLFAEDGARKRISFVKPVKDFKQITTYSLTGDLTYEEIPPGGKIKHGTLGETSYTNQAKSFGKLIGIDRRDLINDDLGALTQLSRRMGRGGALKLNDVFWAAFLDNSAFFTSGNGNYDDGAADTLMDLTGLANANTLFEVMNDPDGKPTGTVPAILLVPPQLWPSAFTLVKSESLNLATSTAASTGTKSPWMGMFELHKSRYLANSSFTGYSAKAWYLLADPNDVAVIETVFLNGMEMPTIETIELAADMLGFGLRAYFDFGCQKQEYRGGVKMKGDA